MELLADVIELITQLITLAMACDPPYSKEKLTLVCRQNVQEIF